VAWPSADSGTGLNLCSITPGALAGTLGENADWLNRKLYGRVPADLGEMFEWCRALGLELLDGFGSRPKAPMKTIVLLHGLGTGSGAWQPQVNYFADRCHVITPDLRGFDETGGTFTFESAVAHVSQVITEHGVDEVVLCGLSLGALVALKYALENASQVESLVLVAGFASLPPELKRQQLAAASQIEALPSEAMASLIEQLSANVASAFRSGAQEALRGFTPGTLAALFREVSDYDVTSQRVGFTRPTLVAWGSDDALNVPLSQDLAGQIPTSTTHVILNAGHVANLDAPEAFNAMLDEFIHSDE
jgi:3-oxoadipate enol-lactonase